MKVMKEEALRADRRAYLDRLAARARTDRAAFVELYNEVFPDVSRFLLSKSRSGEIADEALSRTFLNMYAHLGEYDESRGSFTTWLFRIAANELGMLFREKQRSNSAHWDENLDPSVSERESPEARILKRERERELYGALFRLSEREQKILSMTYWLDMTSEEVAQALGMTSDAVRATLSRSRKTLKKYLEEKN